MGGTGTGADSLLYTLDSGYTAYLPIAPKELERVSFNVEQEFRRTLAAIGGGEEAQG
ncbi:MAG: HDOD domain-containing protein, partial [Planctomycetes bacterium]|nr:HDOD domain-containing protein [Planctomycetota bacterium]